MTDKQFWNQCDIPQPLDNLTERYGDEVIQTLQNQAKKYGPKYVLAGIEIDSRRKMKHLPVWYHILDEPFRQVHAVNLGSLFPEQEQ